MVKVSITGAAGFIGSHLADYLLDQGCEVYGIDNLLTGDRKNLDDRVVFIYKDITEDQLNFEGMDYIFHLAAIGRTGWTIEDPILANEINITGTLRVLEEARRAKVKKVIFASSNIVYADKTPYYVTKKAGEMYMRVYNDLYDLPTLSLRLSNVYGSLRQSEKGPSINVLASLRKTKREKGYIEITGDGEQSRDFTHVLDVAEGFWKAAQSKARGEEIDICTGDNTTLNEIAKYFNCPVNHIGERQGDIKHIIQSPMRAAFLLNFVAKRKLKDEINIYVEN